MKKREALVFCLAINILLALSFISAAGNDTNTSSVSANPFDASYNCLKEQIDSRTYGQMTNEEIVFSLLALGYDGGRQSALRQELDKRKDTSNDCWPAGNCNVKETAQVMLAYTHLNRNVDGIKNWLLNQTGATTDLTWYLQIETTNRSDCTITYDNSTPKRVTVSDEKTISGSAGACLKSAYNGYWLEIDDACYDKEFQISCNSDFLTSTFYKRKSGSTYYITTTTDSQAPNGISKQKVQSLCFKQAGSCNFEASLWATVAVTKKDNSFKDKLLPYLITLSVDSANKKYIPSAFLYRLTTFDEYFADITSSQNTKGYWQLSDTSKRYYDTALALFGLAGHTDSEQFAAAKEYLLDPSVQGTGCWNGNNLRDTAFILYVLDSKIPVSEDTPITKCSDYSDQGYSCMGPSDCDDINGTALPNFFCLSGLTCCSESKPAEKTCAEKNGVICNFGEECSSQNMVSASGTSLCCLDGTCQDQAEVNPISACEQASYTCKVSCDVDLEDTMSLACNQGVCCSTKTIVPSPSYWWVWLLVILVILIILAIIFRNQVQMWYFKIKNKFSKQPMPPQQQRPGMPPAGMPRQIIPGQRPPFPPQRPGMPPQRPGMPYPKQRELDDTLKKLKDMSQ
jgi:hypothetical protein